VALRPIVDCVCAASFLAPLPEAPSGSATRFPFGLRPHSAILARRRAIRPCAKLRPTQAVHAEPLEDLPAVHLRAIYYITNVSRLYGNGNDGPLAVYTRCWYYELEVRSSPAHPAPTFPDEAAALFLAMRFSTISSARLDRRRSKCMPTGPREGQELPTFQLSVPGS